MIKAHEELFDELRDIITVDKKVFAIDPVTRREVLEPKTPAPRLLPKRPEKPGEYPFPVPRSVREELAKLKPPPVARGIKDSGVEKWTPDADIPLHLVKLGYWQNGFRETIHAADERIIKLKPSSEQH